MSQSSPHDSAHLHVTGQSEFIDDRPVQSNELFVAVLYSTEAHAKISKIDFKKALQIPGVAGIFTSKDVVDNRWGTIFRDQPLFVNFAESAVQFAGETLAVIAADSYETALCARAAIVVKYNVLPAIQSIAAAIGAKSYIGNSRKIERGDVEGELKKSPNRKKGHVIIRGAEHFYLESQAAIAYPLEDGGIEVHSSSQHPTEVQHVVAHALGLKQNQVVCIVKRMGGAFGGKESQAAPIAAYAALVAHQLQRPARLILSKDDDMIMTGKRNPFQNFYDVGYDNEGRILALNAQLYSDGGAYADLSTSIMERAMLHIDNAYFIPALRVTGQVCRTNFHPHTAFRGFGGPKGVVTIEKIIEEIAHHLGKDPLDVRKLNCYAAGSNSGGNSDGLIGKDVTHYGQKVENNVLPELFLTLERECDYHDRRRKINASNTKVAQQGYGQLRGLSLTPVKFGISFTTRFLNQANALVIIHRDGTLQISTGATEMGQGVYARISDLAASELGLTRSSIKIMPTTTDKNGNTSPTAASSGTDLNGAAALLAIRKIKYRLSQLAVQLLKTPEARWARHTAGLGTEPEFQTEELKYTSNDANENANWNTGIAEFFGVRFANGIVFHESNPDQHCTFSALINEAFHHRISLSDYAHYHFPNLSFNKVTGQGQAFLYFTQGVAASEVAVDMCTGEVKILRVDILMDLGRPVNKALDLSQVTGAFVQGMGWMTTEKLYYSPNGFLVSHGPSTYKIPSIQDTPRIFNVRLLDNNANHANVRGTKAAGEPPLLLAVSVWTAIHNALAVLPQWQKALPNLELPATSEQVLRSLYSQRFSELETEIKTEPETK